MKINPAIFRMYDIRGIVKEDLTADAVYIIGQAFAAECLAQDCNTVAIGRDGRLHSPLLARKLSEGLRAGGISV